MDGVGEEDDLLAGAVLAEVVVHRTDGYSGLSCACGQVDDAVAIARVLN